MLRSYVSFAARGDVVLRREIMDHLGIGSDGILYGALSPSENSLVLSQIPPQYWERALKIVIHTHHAAGSLAAAAKAISDLEFDTISSWASTESSQGHACFTSIVVYEESNGIFKDYEDIEDKIAASLGEKGLSNLKIFENQENLKRVYVTPLAFLKTYALELSNTDFHEVQVVDHSLQLKKSHPIKSEHRNSTLWSKLLTANQNTLATSCILTPDTEEAFLRISLVEERARLIRLVFRVEIRSDRGSFAGYWKEALDELREQGHNIFVAHNLLISKNAEENLEKAEFYFIVDRRHSPDVGESLIDLRKIWHNRLKDRLQKFALLREAKVNITNTKITYPRGFGVPCFFACNAKQRDGLGAEAAVRLCRMLEGNGFIPVNIDIAAGGEGLQEQVKELIAHCQFMVVLHCPDPKLKSVEKGKYHPAPWVMFEEAVMLGKKGKIIRYRFENVETPAFWHGFTERTIPVTGIEEQDSLLQDFEGQLERWQKQMSKLNSENINAREIDEKHLDRNLVAYYGGRD